MNIIYSVQKLLYKDIQQIFSFFLKEKQSY